MNVYTTDKIRNVAVLGHGSCGKTSLVEAMAFLSGITSRMGKVADGNTISDFDKEEQKRKFSITTSVVPIEWEGVKINFLDTPGYFDFGSEVEEAVSAADAAIIVVSGKAGVEVGTKKAWEICDRFHIPRMIFVSCMDDDNASFRQVVEDLSDSYGKKIAPFHLPIRENEQFVGYANVVSVTGNRWNDKGEVTECEIPDYTMENLESYRDTLIEAVAETSEEFMERYFDGDEFTEYEIRAALRDNVAEGGIVPVTMGSSTLAQGMYTLLDDIVKYMPSPNQRKCAGLNLKTNEVFEGDYDFSKAKSGYVFKSIVDPFIGKYSLVKICSGVLKSDDVIYNTRTETEEKVGKLQILCGNKTSEIKEVHAGDICAIAKLSDTATGDTLATKATPVVYGKTEYTQPYTYKQFYAVNKGDEDKVSSALSKLMQEDVGLKIVNDSANSQTLMYGLGDMHLDVVKSKLLDKYKVEIELARPKIAFKETIRKKSDVEYKYKKQSGGHGQYGHVKMTFEPSGDFDNGYEFEQQVVGGSVPKNFFPAVEKGLAESVLAGPLAGYPVVGIKAVLYDGSYHPVDSSEMAFKVATIQAFKKGVMEASPVLLEPIASMRIRVPDTYTGDVMGDLNKRRARVLGMNPLDGGYSEVLADIPMMELYGYTTVIRSMTGGSGEYSYEFARYEQAPQDIMQKEIDNFQKEE